MARFDLVLCADRAGRCLRKAPFPSHIEACDKVLIEMYQCAPKLHNVIGVMTYVDEDDPDMRFIADCGGDTWPLMKVLAVYRKDEIEWPDEEEDDDGEH